MDFFQICTKEARGSKGVMEIYPDFTVGRAKDLMVQGGAFYAVWNEQLGLWSRDEYDVRTLVDEELKKHENQLKTNGVECNVKYLRSFSNGTWKQFRTFLKNVSDNSHPLDTKVTFANTEVKKTDYVSRRLTYNMSYGEIKAYDELISLLFTDEERAKFEWAIGSIIAGDAKKIQKFLVFYGAPGTGKSTVMDIAYKIFGGLVKDGGYVATFDAKGLVGSNNQFSTSAFKDNPLLAIQHDGDLSKIEDNTKLNSIVSHEDMTVNEKYKAMYDTKIAALLFMGTNKPVRISDAKSGLIRRLIDVRPTGNKHEVTRYFELIAQVEFEIGAIAQHCLDVYRAMGKNYYNSYRPLDMMLQTDVFFNYIEAYFDVFKDQDGATLKQAYALYKEYCKESELDFILPLHKFREELKNYFEEFHDRITINGTSMRSYFVGFTAQPFKTPIKENSKTYSLVLDETVSLLDDLLAGMPAQYGKTDETPEKYWTNEERLINGVMQTPRPDQIVSTTLKDLDTTRIHFLKVPENHVVIDFDLKDKNGNKSLSRNLEAASLWPATYAEHSKSGGGVHLHYFFDGDASELASNYADGIEVKVFRGGSSLRRKLTKCNNIPVATISSGLPFKEKKTVIDAKTIQSERGLRELISRNLRKEIHPGTKPSIDFIAKILDDANKNGMVYDLTDMRPILMTFAQNSTNHALPCLKTVKNMKFKGEGSDEDTNSQPKTQDSRIVIYDCEVYPNLFVICWEYEDSDTTVRMINPSAKEVEALFQYQLVGFNNRKYDNHILWGAFLGYDNAQLYDLSSRIISGDQNAFFGEAYNLSYADIYDFSSIKQSLKKFEITLGLHHMEMDLPWDQPVDKKDWPRVEEYCVNDVKGTKATWKDREQDFAARKILAELSGLTVNDTTQKHTARIIFGRDRKPQDFFVYTDLNKEFPGYVYDFGTSTYRDEVVGEGGYVYAEPGMYENVAVLDVASMHPTSIIQLDLFGKYTEKFNNLLKGRLAVKHANSKWKDAVKYPERSEEFETEAAEFVEEAKKLLPGVGSITKSSAEALAFALKIVINIVYGLTSAKFDNPFRDIRNKDNIVAKRGALFMIDLKNEVQSRGFQVVHIKTDSIKIPNATPEIIEFVTEFGRRYGYEFEHEKTYDKFCLVNDAVYIAREGDKWDAVGAQFQHPVVHKVLFTGEPIKFEDLCETKQVREGAMYLDFNEAEATPAHPYKGMIFVGRVGMFVPVHAHVGGGKLVRVKDEKSYAVTGTKNHLWLEAEMIKMLHLDAVDRLLFEDLTDAINGSGSLVDIVDMSYYETLVDDATKTIEKFGNFERFVK